MKRLTIALFCCFLNLLIYQHVCSETTITGGTIVGQTWIASNSPYVIEGDILVSTLVIEPGVRVEFAGDYVFEIGGVIEAIGTEQNQILFTKTESNDTGWQGIYFHDSNPGSKFIYCRFENAKNSAIRISESLPESIENCIFINNSGANGAAIYIYITNLPNSELNLNKCLFISNSSLSHGGALYVDMDEGKILVINSLFEGNSANFSYNNGEYSGGALYLNNGSASIMNTQFKKNKSASICTNNTWNCSVTARGAAIFINKSDNTDIVNCTFVENHLYVSNRGSYCGGAKTISYGSGTYINNGTVLFKNNLLSHNTVEPSTCGTTVRGVGLFVNNGDVSVLNSTVAYHKDGTGIHNENASLSIMNSIIYFNNNENEQIGGSYTITYSDVQNGTMGTGNISLNPIFYSETNLRIVSGSKCIDAGNPDPIYNDTTFPPSLGTERNDMGAHGGPTPNTPNPIEKPIAYNQSVSTDEGIPITITLNGFDPTGNNTLTYSIEKHPDNGVLTGTPPIVNYSPNQNFDGTDNFTFKVNNSAEDSNIANVSITIKGKLIDTDIYEPDNTYDTSKIIHLYDNIQQNEDIPGYDWNQEHLFETEGDQDWVKIHGVKNGWYTISVKSPEPECDAVIEIYHPDGQTLLKSVNDYQEGQPENIDFQSTSNDIYYVKIKQSDPLKFGPRSGYHLTAVQSYLEFGVILKGHVYVQSSHQPPIVETKLKSSFQTGACGVLEDGSFVMPHPPGTFTFIIEADGYISVKQEITIPKNLTYSQNFYIVKDNNMPYANYFVEKTSGPAPLEVNFNEISSGKPFDLLEWDFGDGYTSAEEDPVHTYEKAGNYTAKLTVARGNNQSVTEVNINVTSNSSGNGGSSGGDSGGGGCFILSLFQ